MAKVAASSTRSPYHFATGNGMYWQHGVDVLEMLNFAACFGCVTNLFSINCEEAGWGGSGDEVATHDLDLTTSSTFVETYEIPVYIDQDVGSVFVGVEMNLSILFTAETRVRLGAESATLSFANSDNGTEKTATLVSPGEGWSTVYVDVRRPSGLGASSGLKLVRGRYVPLLAALLPDPADE